IGALQSESRWWEHGSDGSKSAFTAVGSPVLQGEKMEQEQKAEEERIRMENILSGNPLLNLTGPAQPQANFKVKRRWDDDVVFKNCAKGIDETKKDKRFVNDTLRSEFHKKFMEKYIK
ncbi:PREDICTED: spliceosome-associated protein CWC15 homolog, partial [Eurypyga helias]|uniref:spliceosome-associated protein CWC15 homolog n=1 Tax=Eurypyga helias TaxID=54383 RepID=UPI0005284436